MDIIGFVESSEEYIEFCREVISMLKEVWSELQDAEKTSRYCACNNYTFVL